MADPSANVPPQVLPHIHLVSSHRYPTVQQISPDNAVELLTNAPNIVKNVASMSWQYFQQPPSDGTVFLTWQPPQRQLRYPSDGYLWVDPEATFRAEVRGFTLEILIHQAGIRYQLEPMCMHRRYRYRIVNKNPAAMGTFDPSLWLVHYSLSEPQYRYPHAQIQISQDMQKMFAERSLMEKQGQLLRKEFMLHDRLNWPKVEFASAAHVAAQGRPMFPGAPQPMAALNRHPQFMQHQAPGIGPSPAKRLRQAPPPQLAGNAPASVMAINIDIADEEDTSLGDALDHLTAREISTMRYQQHHEWMDSILSSPYAAGQILPIDLGFGLMGELAPLTDGLFDITNPQAKELPAKVPAPKTFKKLEPAQYAEFEKRVLAYQRKAEEEIDALKAEHAKKLADLKRTRTYVQAERKLRDAEWDSTAASGADGISDGPFNRSNSPEPQRKVAQVISDVEKGLKVTIGPSKDIITIEKGGLIENQAPQTNGTNAPQANNLHENGQLNGLLDESALDADNTAASLLDEFTQNSLGNTPGVSLSAAVSQPGSLINSNAPTPGANATGDAPQTTSQAADLKDDTPSADIAAMPHGDDMDLDLDLGDSLDAPLGDKSAENDWVMVDQPADKAQELQQPASQNTINATTTTQSSTSADIPATTVSTDVTGQSTHDPLGETGDTPGMFDGTEFDAFDNLDTAGDALADAYGGADDDLGLDLDNSAFGDAFQDGVDGNDV